MQVQCEHAIKNLEWLTNKKQKLDDAIVNAERLQKTLLALLSSPIFQFIHTHLMEDVAMLVFNYLDLEYCCKHQTHFPKIIKECVGCMKMPQNDSFLYDLTHPPKIKNYTNPKRTEIIDFHSDDNDFKHHLIRILSLLHAHCKTIDNWSTSRLKSKKLRIYLPGGNSYPTFQIKRQDGKTTKNDWWQCNLKLNFSQQD